MDELDTERVTYCMASLGGARRCLEIATEYATKRVQFKQPLAMFEGVSFKLAEMYAQLDAARQLIYRTAKLIEAGRPAIFRNARLMRIGAGSDEIMKFLIARELLREVKG